MKVVAAHRTKPTESAVLRARKAWADMASAACVEARSMGLSGQLPRFLNDAKNKKGGIPKRGVAVPTGILHTAKALRESGISREAAEQRLTDQVRYIVSLTYNDSAA